MSIPNCLKCNSEYVYEDGQMYVCPECAYEWSKLEQEQMAEAEKVKDVNGKEIQNGDTVIIIKDLKVKGARDDLKIGTKVKNIKLDSDGVHNLSGKVDGFGVLYIKSEYVKKVVNEK